MYPRHEVGKYAEIKAAEWFLLNKKSTLLAKNYRCKFGEIDLIFEETIEGTIEGTLNENRSGSRKIELVFVEVRARLNPQWVDGPTSITLQKRKRLQKTADHYLARYRGPAQSLRFDLLYWDGVTWESLESFWLD